jgi:hypothetical protein
MPDAWEKAAGLNPRRSDAAADPDHDELTNIGEYRARTKPRKADSDTDGMPDGWEVRNHLNPTRADAGADPDGDELTNLDEFHIGNNPKDADSDHDGTHDGEEKNGTITAFDAETGALSVTTAAGVTLNVTVTDKTEIRWQHKSSKCTDPAGTSDLTPARLVHKIEADDVSNDSDDEDQSPPGGVTVPVAEKITLVCS